MNEPKVPRYSQHISQLCLRLKITDCSAKEALASAMSFILNQAMTAHRAMNGTQMNAAFCAQMVLVSPAALTMVCGSPPNTENATIMGATNCTVDTPRLPSPAFTPSAEPLRSLGKKKLMFAIDDEKFPQPKPHSSARISMVG